MQQLTLTQPDDWHIHLRDGDVLNTTVDHASRAFSRAIVMPNLKPAVTNTQKAREYRDRILAALPQGRDFEPLMTLYLTDNTSPGEMQVAKSSGFIPAVKWYPAGATTNSNQGVTDSKKVFPVLEAMQEQGMLLLIHGEATDPDIDVFEREKRFLGRELDSIRETFPELRIVLEHITTKDAVDYVTAANQRTAATITAHHLMLNRNHMLAGGIRPHYYCAPILKSSPHQLALREAATSGNPKFFLGTDSAPHPIDQKESACGCAGVYTAHAAMSFYAQVFEEENALDKLEGFASFFGADFYEYPRNTKTITLEKAPFDVPENYLFGQHRLRPLMAGEQLHWRLA